MSSIYYIIKIITLLSLFISIYCATLVTTGYGAHRKVVGFKCPNNCSGKGSCERDSVCKCIVGRFGPDCSLLECPKDAAWADKAYDVDKAHSLSECSRKGLCNRSNGLCKCFEGYEGRACQQLKCDSNCGPNGRCLTMALQYHLYVDNSIHRTSNYSRWDRDHASSCVCDFGYTGSKCDQKICPKGFDPLRTTTNTGHRTINILTYAAMPNEIRGVFRFIFNGASFAFPADTTIWNDAACVASFQSLPNVKSATCTAINSIMNDNYVHNATIELVEFPSTPYENNYYTYDGSKKDGTFSCDTSLVVGGHRVTCDVTDVTSPSITPPTYSYCSNRGLCDFKMGICTCFNNFHSSNCGVFNDVVVNSYATPIDIFTIKSTFPGFNNNLVRVSHDDFGSNSYYRAFIVQDSREKKIVLDSSGCLHSQGLSIGNGVSIHNTGITVEKDGVTVSSNGLIVDYLSTLYLGIAGSGIRVTGGTSISLNGITVNGGILLNNGGVNVVHGGIVTQAGGFDIHTGGLTIKDSLQIKSGGLLIRKKGGISVYDEGLTIAGGLSVKNTGGIKVWDGIQVNEGGLYITIKGMTMSAEGLFITGGVTVLSDGIVTSHADMNSGGLVITAGLSIFRDGIKVVGGLTVNNNGMIIDNHYGLNVMTGGLQTDLLFIDEYNIEIKSHGLTITNGLTINNAGVSLYDGLSIRNKGLVSNGGINIVQSDGCTVNQGLTIAAVGLKIHDSGVTITNYGLNILADDVDVTHGFQVAGGMTVFNDGINAKGGLTVLQNGLFVTKKGLTVINEGLVITGGLTIRQLGLIGTGVIVHDKGMTVLNSKPNVGIEVHTSGVNAKDGLSVLNLGVKVANTIRFFNGGVYVTGGMTVHDRGLKVSGSFTTDQLSPVPNGLTVTSNGITSAKKILINDRGLNLVNGLSIEVDGLSVTGLVKVVGSGVVITGGVTVHNNGLLIHNNMMSVVDTGVNILTNGMSISSHGLKITAGILSVSQTGLQVVGGLTLNLNGLGVFGGATISKIYNHGVRDSSPVVFKADKVTVQGYNIGGSDTHTAIHIANSGLVVTGGISLDNRGLSILGGLSVKSFGIKSSSLIDKEGIYITDGGATVASGGIDLVEGAGLTITSGGIQVNNGGLSVFHTGLVATGGMSISVGGLRTSRLAGMDAGMLVYSDGLHGGMTISSGGLRVTGGLSVVDLAINNGMRVYSKGMKVNTVGGYYKGGITINSGGLTVLNFQGKGGLTVSGLGVTLENSPTVFSDRRLKQNIMPISNSLDIINNLRGVLYSWNREKIVELSLDDKRHIGFIAQDAQEVIPEIVSMMKNGEYLGINYEEVIPVLIESIKELNRRTNDATTNAIITTTTDNMNNVTTSIKNYNREQVLNAIDDLKLFIAHVEIDQNKLM